MASLTHARRAGLLAVVLAACGGGSGQVLPSGCSTPSGSPKPPARVVAGQLTAFADRAVVARSGVTRLALVATGPLRYVAACDGPVQAVITDRADIHVATLTAAAPRGTPCGDVTLAPGQSVEYDILWSPDPTLPAGAYGASLSLGDQPAIGLPLVLGQPPLACSTA